MVIRSFPLALLSVLLLGAACQQTGSAAAASAPSPTPSTLAQRAQKADHPVSQPVRSGHPAAPATPRAAQSPSLSAVYANAIQVDAQHLLSADGLRVASCGGRNPAGCLTALQQVASSASALQKDLDAHPAPPCLKNADTTLRSAISLYLQGAQVDTRGVNDASGSEMTQGKGLLDQGATQFRAASTQLGQSGCSVPPPAVAP